MNWKLHIYQYYPDTIVEGGLHYIQTIDIVDVIHLAAELEKASNAGYYCRFDTSSK